jgi:hypothetical protein
MNSNVAIGGVSKPFPKLKRRVIKIGLQAPVMVRTMAVPSNYTNVIIESIRIDDHEILVGDMPAQALSFGMLDSFADIADGMVAKDSVTVVLRRLKSDDMPYAPRAVVISRGGKGKARWRWNRRKWSLFPTASRRKPLQFAISASTLTTKW